MGSQTMMKLDDLTTVSHVAVVAKGHLAAAGAEIVKVGSDGRRRKRDSAGPTEATSAAAAFNVIHADLPLQVCLVS